MAKTRKRPPAKRDGLSTQAELEAFVRYGGQLGELARMARDTDADARSRASDAVAAGDAIRQTARQARPELQRIYDSSAGEMARRETNLRSELAKLGSAADPYKAGGLFTSTTSANRLSGEKSSALRELVGREQDAISGARFGAQQARDQGRSEVQKIREKMMDVQAESGAYQAGRIGELKEGQRERAIQKRGQDKTAASQRASRRQQERNSVRSSGIDPDTGKPIPGGKLDPKAKPKEGPKLQTPDKHYSIRSEIDRALQVARSKSGEWDRAQTARFLTNQIPDSKGEDGTEIPGRKPNDELSASVALDLAYDGHISRRNIERLHAQRLSVRQLGLGDKTRAKPKPKLPRAGGTARVGAR